MTEEVNTENTEVVVSPVEQEAIAQGWVPKAEFQGDEGKWVDAGEFLRRGELFGKIDAQRRDLQRTQKEIEALKQHLATVKETEFKHALATLKAERAAALKEGDVDTALKLEDQIEEVKKDSEVAVEQLRQVSQESQIHPEFAAWVNRNTWYGTNPGMKDFADEKGREYARAGMSPPDVLKQVEQDVRKQFSHRFTNPNQNRVSAVEGGNSKSVTKSGGDDFEKGLTDMERNTMNVLVRGGHITKEKYLADLKKVKG